MSNYQQIYRPQSCHKFIWKLALYNSWYGWVECHSERSNRLVRVIDFLCSYHFSNLYNWKIESFSWIELEVSKFFDISVSHLYTFHHTNFRLYTNPFARYNLKRSEVDYNRSMQEDMKAFNDYMFCNIKLNNISQIFYFRILKIRILNI